MNQNYHYEQKMDYSKQVVFPMCCCCYSVTEKGFYTFINLFDLLMAVFVLVYSALTLKESKIVGSSNLSLYALWFVISGVSLIIYCSSNKNYGSCLHKIYAIIRMGLTIINLAFVCFGTIAVIVQLGDEDLKSKHTEFVFGLILNVLFFIPMGIVSVNWSCILSKVVHNRSLMNNY